MLLAGALAAVGGTVVVGLDERDSATASTPTTTLAPAATVPPPSLPEPESEEADPVRGLLPSIVAVAEEPVTPEESQALIDAALTEQRHDVAVPERPATLCAVVPVLAPVMAAGRWERDGEHVASSSEQLRDVPGYGECLPADGDDAVPEGVYQYVAVGLTGAASAAGTLVVGAVAADIWLLNNGDESVCLVLMSPREADFYDAFDAETPLLPGEAISVTAADTELDVRVYGCTDGGLAGDFVRRFRLTPGESTYVSLFAEDDTEGSDPPGT